MMSELTSRGDSQVVSETGTGSVELQRNVAAQTLAPKIPAPELAASYDDAVPWHPELRLPADREAAVWFTAAAFDITGERAEFEARRLTRDSSTARHIILGASGRLYIRKRVIAQLRDAARALESVE